MLCVIKQDNLERGGRLSSSLGKWQDLGNPLGNKTGLLEETGLLEWTGGLGGTGGLAGELT